MLRDSTRWSMAARTAACSPRVFRFADESDDSSRRQVTVQEVSGAEYVVVK